MEHVAIMKRSWGLTGKLLSGEKRAESRWYKSKRPPWGSVSVGDTVYFKNSGEPVEIKSEVEKVLQFSELNPKKVKQILSEYGKLDGIDKNDSEKFEELFKDKLYCVLIFLKKVKRVDPFEINKKGFGSMSAWIIVEDINRIRK